MERSELAGLKQERIISIDIIRGFSIFGIYLVNMMSFHSPLLYIDPLTWWQEPFDHITYVGIDIFAQASFYPLFSIMFGYSIVLLSEKLTERGLNFNKLALRRLGALLIFGVLHAFFVWHGDILIQYAVLGSLLLFFVSMSGRSLLITGIALYGLPALFLTLLLFFLANGEVQSADFKAVAQSIKIYSQGSFMDITKQRVHDWSATNNLWNFPFLFLSIFPLFLIGAGIAKLKWLEQPAHHRNIHSIVLIITLSLGLFCKVLPYLFGGAAFAQYAQDSLGGLCLAIFYGGLLIKMAESATLIKWLRPLAAIGRMSISNYLFQSLLSSFIFYQYGFGLYGKLSLFCGTVLVLVIFCFQILLSKLWLRRFAYGPVEWLWRSLTYLKPFNIRKPGI